MPNFPKYSIIQQRKKYGRKAEQEKGCTQQTEINVGFFFPFGLFFKQKVSKHTRLFSDGHKEYLNGSSTALSWLEIIPRNL